MTENSDRTREEIQRELAEARGDLSRLQKRRAAGSGDSAELRAATERVVALQQELEGAETPGP